LNRKLFSQKKRSALLAGVILFLLLSGIFFSQAQPFIKLSVKDYPTLSRVIIDSSFPLSFDIEKSSSLLMINVRTDVPFRIQRGAFESRIMSETLAMIILPSAIHRNWSLISARLMKRRVR
jgi:hypothetical protein